MAGDNGHAEKTRAVKLVEYFREKQPGTLSSVVNRSILLVMGKVYRNVDTNQVDHAMREVLTFAKNNDGVTEEEMFEAIFTIFKPDIPIVYPEQFNPIIIFAPDGSVLWRKPDKKEEPKALPAKDEPIALPADTPST